MTSLVLSLLRLVAVAWLVLGMSVPVSAWTMHEAAHGATQVSPDTHHHHDDDGGISVDDHDDGETPDGGHDHMPSLLLGAVAIPNVLLCIAVPDLERTVFIDSADSGVARNGTDALRRPPRFG